MSGMFLPLSYADGFAAAPSATIQYPNILNGYAAVPTWHVAGVHYAVGPDNAYSSAYLDPATLSGTGLTVNSGTKSLTINAATAGSVTLTGYDFTNWQIYFTGTGTNRLSILHCKFFVGSNNYKPIYCDANAGNLTVQYCDLDGNANTSIGSFGMVTCPAGAIVIEYNRFRNTVFDGVKFGAVTSMRGRYNLFDVMGFGATPHFDCFQLQDSPAYSVQIAFNTAYHTVAGNEFNSLARIASVSTSAINLPDIGFNTIILLQTGVSNAIQVRGNDVVGGLIIGPYIHDNYIDYSGSDGGSGKAIVVSADTSTIVGDICVRNINMVTGGAINENA